MSNRLDVRQMLLARNLWREVAPAARGFWALLTSATALANASANHGWWTLWLTLASVWNIRWWWTQRPSRAQGAKP